jgi:glycosyltransferase involved in cell wall biosynthesis
MTNLKIDIYCRDGSPLKITPPMIYGRGVGGAELSMMTWAETMAKRGHQIRVYNNPDTAGDYDGVSYLPQSDFEPGYRRDVLIVYRSPTPDVRNVKASVKIHWSTDQFTMGDYARDIVPFVDKIICISPYHMADYQGRLITALSSGVWPTHQNRTPNEGAVERNTVNAPLDKITYIDLGVRLQDYPLEMEKVLNRFIFCSVPERGLTVIKQIWPRIKEALPDATLVITSDHRLWGSHSPNNHKYRLDLLSCDGIVFLGAIERHELARHQAQAQIHLFPCLYPELFCISAAECQTVGAVPITSDAGALATTNEFGFIVPGNPEDPTWQKIYVDLVVTAALDQDVLIDKAKEGIKLARERFDWDRICDEWEQVIEGQSEEK